MCVFYLFYIEKQILLKHFYILVIFWLVMLQFYYLYEEMVYFRLTNSSKQLFVCSEREHLLLKLHDRTILQVITQKLTRLNKKEAT